MTTSPATNAPPIDAMNFEQALSALETIVRGLESGDTTLENSITAYERGMALKKHCEDKLRDAQAKIEKITVSPNGTLSSEPLDKPQTDKNQKG